MAPFMFSSCFGRGGGSSISSAAVRTDGTCGGGGGGGEQQQSSVLVELFCSQGCAASQEAEAVVCGRVEAGVVVVTWHVDYWDYRGWKDPLGCSAWTVRQKAFVESLCLDTLYTPQAVVMGRAQCLATDADALSDALLAAPRFASPTMLATFKKVAGDALQVSLTGALHSKVDSGGVDVMVALCESGMTTECKRGENKGKLLRNDHVVRRLEKLLTAKDVSAKKNLSGSVRFSLWDGFSAANCGLVLFVQNKSLQIFGVQHFHIPPEALV